MAALQQLHAEKQHTGAGCGQHEAELPRCLPKLSQGETGDSTGNQWRCVEEPNYLHRLLISVSSSSMGVPPVVAEYLFVEEQGQQKPVFFTHS